MERDDRDPGLHFRDGVPASGRFDDVYFSRDGGLEESAHVFLAGAGLPEAWAGRRRFTIAETGFGTGLNFLAAWDLWRRHRPPGGVLHYLAVEGYPIARGSLAGVLAPFRALAGLTARLIELYPRPVPGLHRLWLDADGVCLTLAIGEAAEILPRLAARVDAWFLDGFAPARNPGMWEPRVLDEVARLAAPGCRVATFTAAGVVRRGLAERGFAMRRRSGHGSKRESLAGERPGAAPADGGPRRVAVVGAGVAGASLAGAVARRGIELVWLDRRPHLAAEASGNPLGVLMPRPTLAGPAGALSAAAFRHVLAECAARGVAVGGDGVLELAEDAAALTRQMRLAAGGLLDPVDGRPVDAVEASRIAGVSLDRPGIWYRRAGWVRPPQLVRALAGPADARLGVDVARLQPADGGWRLLDAAGGAVAEAGAVVLAAGASGSGFPELVALPVRPVRGELVEVPETAASRRLRTVLTFGGYLSPAVGGRHVAGATYDRDGFDPVAWPQPLGADGQRRILAGLPGLLAGWFAGVAAVGGRAALRAATPDRLPIAGGVPGFPGLHVLSGLGSRGLVTAPLLAELLMSEMLGEPLPLELDLAEAVRPARFAERATRRNDGRRR